VAKKGKLVSRPTENAALARIKRQARKLGISEQTYIRFCSQFGDIVVGGQVDPDRLRHARAIDVAGLGG
jgi:formylmethanofuran dehydrogenase subunit D